MVSSGPCWKSLRRRTSGLCLAGLLLLCYSPVLRAASPRDALLRFVPENTAFCVVLQELRSHWAALRDSPFAEQFRRSSLAEAAWGSEERQKLERAEKHLQMIGLDWARVRDELLGDAIVFAFRPGPPGKPEQDQGLFLLHAQNAKVLADLIDQFNDLETKAEVLKNIEERQYNGVTYLRRVSTRSVTYYLVRGPILVLTGQEGILRQALDQEQALAREAEPLLVRQLKQMSADRALLALWVNPRAFDAAMAARATQAAPAERAAATTMAACWTAVEGLVLSLHLERELSLVLAVRGRSEQLPAPARVFLAQASRTSELWRLLPEDPLLALTGRIDLSALFDTLGEFLSPKGRQSLQSEVNRTLGATIGRNFIKEILPHLGPDLGLCLIATAEHEKEWLPRVLLALRVAEGDPVAPADKAILEVVQLLVRVLILAHNTHQAGPTIELKKRLVEKQEIWVVSGNGVFPPGVQPAFALRNGYLVLASSPEVIERLAQSSPGSLPASTRGIPVLLRVSFKAWHAFLTDRRSELIDAMTASKELARSEAAKRIDGVVEGLQLLDRLELRQQTSKNQVVLTLSVQPRQPLRK